MKATLPKTVAHNGWQYDKTCTRTIHAIGYHKDSAALSAALDSAGITLSEDIAGRGDGPMREALTAIVRATGCRGKVLIV